MTDKNIEPEFSRHVSAKDLPNLGTSYEIKANDVERAALARRFNLPEIGHLRAEMNLRPVIGGPLVRLTGRLSAKLTRVCGVSLEHFETEVNADFERLYGPESVVHEREEDIDPEADEPPDPFIQGGIDLGEAVAEELSLALDPFPKKPGAAFADITDQEEESSRNNPFAVLASLRDKKV